MNMRTTLMGACAASSLSVPPLAGESEHGRTLRLPAARRPASRLV